MKDAREVVKTGLVVKVRVLEVDLQRKRIALTMKLGESVPERPVASNHRPPGPGSGPPS